MYQSYIQKHGNVTNGYIYKHLYGDGKCVQFDLTENAKKNWFKYEKDMSVRSYEENEFTRTITFPTNIERT